MKYFGDLEIEKIRVGRTVYAIIFSWTEIKLDEICPICGAKFYALKAERPIIVGTKNPPSSTSHLRVRKKLAITKLNFILKEKTKICSSCCFEQI